MPAVRSKCLSRCKTVNPPSSAVAATIRSGTDGPRCMPLSASISCTSNARSSAADVRYFTGIAANGAKPNSRMPRGCHHLGICQIGEHLTEPVEISSRHRHPASVGLLGQPPAQKLVASHPLACLSSTSHPSHRVTLSYGFGAATPYLLTTTMSLSCNETRVGNGNGRLPGPIG